MTIFENPKIGSKFDGIIFIHSNDELIEPNLFEFNNIKPDVIVSQVLFIKEEIKPTESSYGQLCHTIFRNLPFKDIPRNLNNYSITKDF